MSPPHCHITRVAESQTNVSNGKASLTLHNFTYDCLRCMCHRAIKVGNVKNCSIEYRIIKPLTLCDLLHDFIIELLEFTCHKSATKHTISVQ